MTGMTYRLVAVYDALQKQRLLTLSETSTDLLHFAVGIGSQGHSLITKSMKPIPLVNTE
jgi:hypothetical protein